MTMPSALKFAAQNIAHYANQVFLVRDAAAWPSRFGWAASRVAMAMSLALVLPVALHVPSRGVLSSSDWLHAVPGAPGHDFWCVVVMATLLRAALFAWMAFSFHSWALVSSIARQERWALFQEEHGNNTLSRVAFNKIQGNIPHRAAAAAPCLLLGAVATLFTVPVAIPFFDMPAIDNAAFLWVVHLFSWMFAGLFALLMTSAILILLSEYTIPFVARAAQKIMNRVPGREDEFDQLPATERNTFQQKARALGVDPQDRKLRRVAVVAYRKGEARARAMAQEMQAATIQVQTQHRAKRL